MERITPVDPQTAQGKAKQLLEVVAHVALNIFTNYFNNVAGTAIDFPRAPALSA